MALGAVSDELVFADAAELDAQHQAVPHVEVAVDQHGAAVQLAQLAVRQHGESVLVVLRIAAPEPDLVESAAAPRLDAEAARRDLGIEPALVAARDVVEDLAPVRDEPREDVEPAGRALRVRHGGDDLGQVQMLDQLDDIDAAALEHRAVVEIDHVELQLVQLLLDRLVAAGQETRAHAKGLGAEAQVEARRLELALADVLGRAQHVAVHELADLLPRQEAGLAGKLPGTGTPFAGEILIPRHDQSRSCRCAHGA